jgi:hypothetical protein
MVPRIIINGTSNRMVMPTTIRILSNKRITASGVVDAGSLDGACGAAMALA